MKSKKILGLAVLALLVAATGTVYADMVEGKVVSVDLAGKALKVSTVNEAGEAQDLDVAVSDTTTYSGEVTALAEVVEGDQVKIEADKDAATGSLVAKSVDVAAVEEVF